MPRWRWLPPSDGEADRETGNHGGVAWCAACCQRSLPALPPGTNPPSPDADLTCRFPGPPTPLIGAYTLNPMCALIFIAGSLLEASYCLLWEVSSFRTIVSGAVKTSGGMAALFAVDPNPSPFFLIILFLWLFLWEIGGQNIPADWADIERDRSIQAKTIPVRLGPERAKAVILFCLVLAVIMNVILFRLTPVRYEHYYVGVCFLVGAYLLIHPAYRLFKSNNRQDALTLFNRACYYPLSLLVVIAIGAMI